MGRSVHIRPDWEEIKVQTMLDLLKCKFQDPELKQKLLDTGDEELVEYNTWGDNFWGRTMEGFGLNMLGKLLMEVRDGRFQ